MIPIMSRNRVFGNSRTFVLTLGLTLLEAVGSQSAFAVDTKPTGKSAEKAPEKDVEKIVEKTVEKTAEKPVDVGPKDRVRYTKSKKLDFNSQTVEGVLQRPETALITASESLSTNGILRLREDFLDKYAADIGEPVP